MTQHSLHAAVSIGLDSDTIIARLSMLCKTKLPSTIERFIKSCTLAYGKVKMVVVDDKFYLETPSREIYNTLTVDEVPPASFAFPPRTPLASSASCVCAHPT